MLLFTIVSLVNLAHYLLNEWLFITFPKPNNSCIHLTDPSWTPIVLYLHWNMRIRGLFSSGQSRKHRDTFLFISLPFSYFKRATTLLLWCYLTRDAINWMKLRLTLEICHDSIPGSQTVFKVLPHPLFKVRDDPMKFAGQIMDWDPKKWRNRSRFHGLWGPNCTSDMFFFNFVIHIWGEQTHFEAQDLTCTTTNSIIHLSSKNFWFYHSLTNL